MKRIVALTISFLYFLQTVGLAYSYNEIEEEEQYEIIVEVSQTKAPRKGNSVTLMGGSLCVTPEALYTDAINGFSAKATKDEIAELQNTPGVLNVYISRQYHVPTTHLSLEEGDIMPFSQDDEYLGQGTAIAVLDSEFLVSHEYFSLTDEETVKYNRNNINEKLSELSIEATVDDVYKSAKIPFAYDYACEDNNTASADYHGTSVAGVAAGQNDTYKGAAPKAQLVLMKVFDDNGTASDTTILSAIDDAIKLGVDVINLSFGVEAGFSDELYEEAFTNAQESGIIVVNSAGNNGMVGYNSGEGHGPLTTNPDYGTIASPALGNGTTAVAAFQSKGDEVFLENGFRSVNGTMAPFSSRGATSDLKLKPEISALGYSVYLPVGSGSSLYGRGNGTSYSAPYVSGLSAVVKGYVGEAFDIEQGEVPLLCNNLIMCTSDVISYDGVPYSPRTQGSGMANIEKALATPVVLYGPSDSKAKIELGNELSNTINFTFAAKNFTDSDKTYELCGTAVTDDFETTDNVSRIKMTPRQLASAEFTFTGGSSIVIPAGGTCDIEVTLTLDEDETGALYDVFTNGFFIDGFIQLSSENDPVLNMPFTGFYGNWYSLPIFDVPVSRGGGEYNITGIVKGGDYLGSVFGSDDVRDDYMAVTPGAVTFFAAALHRNVSEMKVEFIDSNNITVETAYIGAYMRKAFYAGNGDLNYEESNTWTWKKGTGVLDDGPYTCRITASLDVEGGYSQSIEFEVFVDSEAPVITNIDLMLSGESGQMSIEAEDNHLTRAAGISTGSTHLFSPMENNSVTISDAGEDYVYVQVWDCAGNIGYAQLAQSEGYVAYYEGSKLLDVIKRNVSVWNNQVVTSYDSENTVKIFAWDGLNPVAKRKSLEKY